MEREIEIKVLGIDLKQMEISLIRLGATKIAEEEQETTVINSTAHPIKDDLGYLRIRKTRTTDGTEMVCTFKHKRADVGVRRYDEYTVCIDDVKEMCKIFELMGYDIQETGKKHRISYRYKNCRFDLDCWEEKIYPEPYMEIEADSRDAIDSVLEELKIDPSKITTRSIAELRKTK